MTKKTYLMLNCRNGFLKIGISDRPAYREKTLQSEEPEILLIAVIDEGQNFESMLHKTYAHLRLRGEWFALTPDDVQEILRRGFEPIKGREDF